MAVTWIDSSISDDISRYMSIGLAKKDLALRREKFELDKLIGTANIEALSAQTKLSEANRAYTDIQAGIAVNENYRENIKTLSQLQKDKSSIEQTDALTALYGTQNRAAQKDIDLTKQAIKLGMETHEAKVRAANAAARSAELSAIGQQVANNSKVLEGQVNAGIQQFELYNTLMNNVVDSAVMLDPLDPEYSTKLAAMTNEAAVYGTDATNALMMAIQASGTNPIDMKTSFFADKDINKTNNAIMSTIMQSIGTRVEKGRTAYLTAQAQAQAELGESIAQSEQSASSALSSRTQAVKNLADSLETLGISDENNARDLTIANIEAILTGGTVEGMQKTGKPIAIEAQAGDLKHGLSYFGMGHGKNIFKGTDNMTEQEKNRVMTSINAMRKKDPKVRFRVNGIEYEPDDIYDMLYGGE